MVRFGDYAKPFGLLFGSVRFPFFFFSPAGVIPLPCGSLFFLIITLLIKTVYRRSSPFASDSERRLAVRLRGCNGARRYLRFAARYTRYLALACKIDAVHCFRCFYGRFLRCFAHCSRRCSCYRCRDNSQADFHILPDSRRHCGCRCYSCFPQNLLFQLSP